jgi:hypothetical protein
VQSLSFELILFSCRFSTSDPSERGTKSTSSRASETRESDPATASAEAVREGWLTCKVAAVDGKVREAAAAWQQMKPLFGACSFQIDATNMLRLLLNVSHLYGRQRRNWNGRRRRRRRHLVLLFEGRKRRMWEFPSSLLARSKCRRLLPGLPEDNIVYNLALIGAKLDIIVHKNTPGNPVCRLPVSWRDVTLARIIDAYFN